MTAPVTHSAHVAVNPHAVLLVGAMIAVYLAGLWVKARLLNGRVTRSLTRSMALPTHRAQTRALTHPRTMARVTRSRRATWRFRKAMFITALIAAVWLWTQFHAHTH